MKRQAARDSLGRRETARRSRSPACSSQLSAGSPTCQARASSRTRESRRRVSRFLYKRVSPELKTDWLFFPVDGKERFVSYKEWNDLVQQNFERVYYVPADPSEDSKYAVDPSLIARRGIYKDVYGTPAGRARADYQLRGNFPIAMAVAPELFTPKLAYGALQILEANLVGPLGVKTLDPADPDYRREFPHTVVPFLLSKTDAHNLRI